MLPQQGDEVFLTDGGVETDMIFNRGIGLPEFASFVLHDDPDAERVAREYETLTWRASAAWGSQLGYDGPRLRALNQRAAEFLLGLREREAGSPVVVSGCIGPRGDAYSDLGSMAADESEELDDGDPDELGGQLAALHSRLPNLTVLGGCCGTDHRHIEATAAACASR